MNEYDPAPQEPEIAPPQEAAQYGSESVKGGEQKRRPTGRLLTKRKCRRIVAAAMLAPMIGLSVGLLASPAASAAQPASSAHAGPPGPAGGGSNARSGPAAGGSSGTVTSVSKSGFTMTTSAGQKVTVDESSSSAIGASVLVDPHLGVVEE
jgi:hypothetical protein